MNSKTEKEYTSPHNRSKTIKCPACNENNTVKAGKRDTKAGKIQRYYCKSCEKYFSEKKEPYTQYPINVILYTLQQYNKGHSVKEAKKQTGKRYQYSPPIRTIYSWIDRYEDTMTFLKLRKEYNVDPDNLTTTHNFQHQAGNKFPTAHKSRFVHNKSIHSHITT